MNVRIISFLSILMILIVYSFEINFMPNYNRRPDNWHLFVPMIGFFTLLVALLLWSVFEIIKKRQKYLDIVLIVASILLFALLNNPKGDFQTISYAGLILVNIIYAILFLINDKKIFPLKR